MKHSVKTGLIHVALFIACFIAGCIIAFGLSFFYSVTHYFPFYVLSFILQVLAVVGYPLFALTFGLIRVIRSWRQCRPIPMPFLAKLVFGLAAASSVAASDSVVDAIIRGGTAAHGTRIVAAQTPGRLRAFVTTLILYAWGYSLVIAFIGVFVFPTQEQREAMLWFAFFATLAVALYCVISPVVVTLASLRQEYTERWHTEEPAAEAAANPFALDREKRRKYIRLPKTISLCTIAYIVLLIAFILLVPTDQSRAFLDQYQPIRYFFIVITFCALFGFIPFLAWWGICSGRSLTQRINLNGASLTYHLTSGTGPDSETKTYEIIAVSKMKVGHRCIHVHAYLSDRRRSTYIWMPKTFVDNNRVIAELQTRVKTN